MAKASDLMGLGMAPALAGAIGNGEATLGATATGSTQADAYALVNPTTTFTTTAASTGARLPNASGQPTFVVLNAGASDLTLYPATGETINAIAANGGFTVTAAKSVICTPCGTKWICTLSA